MKLLVSALLLVVSATGGTADAADVSAVGFDNDAKQSMFDFSENQRRLEENKSANKSAIVLELLAPDFNISEEDRKMLNEMSAAETEPSSSIRRLNSPLPAPQCLIDNCSTTGILTQSDNPFYVRDVVSYCVKSNRTYAAYLSSYWARCFDLDGEDHQCTSDRLVESVTFIPTKAFNIPYANVTFSINIYTTDTCVDRTYPNATTLVKTKTFTLLNTDYGSNKTYPIEVIVPKDKVMWVEIAYEGTDGLVEYEWGPDLNNRLQCEPWYVRCGTRFTTTDSQYQWRDPMRFGDTTLNNVALSMTIQTQAAASIRLDKTVKRGADLPCNDQTAGDEREYIECPVCTDVTYCYKVTNTGGRKLCNIQVEDNLHMYSETLTNCLDPGFSAYLKPQPSVILNGIVRTNATAVGEPSFANNTVIPYMFDVVDQDDAEVRPSCCFEKTIIRLPGFKQKSCLKPEMQTCPRWETCADWMIKPKQCMYDTTYNPVCDGCITQ